MTVHDLVADDILDIAYDWLCRRRRNYPSDADVWTLRRTWPTVKATLRADLLAGRYRLGLLRRVVNPRSGWERAKTRSYSVQICGRPLRFDPINRASIACYFGEFREHGTFATFCCKSWRRKRESPVVAGAPSMRAAGRRLHQDAGG